MADVTITISVPEVYKLVARRSSVTSMTDSFYEKASTEQKQYSQLHGESDRITNDLLKEAAKEVLKCFVSRQGDVTGTPFEISATEINYRFAEGTPVLTQAAAIKQRLADNAKDAVVYHILAALYKMDGNTNQATINHGKSIQLIDELMGDLYRLHD